jgi:hypothetical protein
MGVWYNFSWTWWFASCPPLKVFWGQLHCEVLLGIKHETQHLQQCSVCDPAKIFFTSKFSYVLLFCNPANRTETGTANTWGITNSKPPGPIIMMGRSETLREHICYTLFCRCTELLDLLLGNVHNCAAPKPISWAKPAFVGISSSNFTVHDHILSTIGDALIGSICVNWSLLKYMNFETINFFEGG